MRDREGFPFEIWSQCSRTRRSHRGFGGECHSARGGGTHSLRRDTCDLCDPAENFSVTVKGEEFGEPMTLNLD